MTKPSDDFYKRMANTSPGVLFKQALDMLDALDLENKKLQYFKTEIQRQASHRRECVDDYVMGAKAAFDDYFNKDPNKLDPK